MRPAAEAEKLGIPSVVITTTGFTNIAKAVGRAEGLTGLRVAEYPGAVGVHAEALVQKNVETVLFDRIVAELTQPRPGDSEGALGSE
ncbi:MAG: UGSC family (seleno)protein, partial [Burkholderiales bacterium]